MTRCYVLIVMGLISSACHGNSSAILSPSKAASSLLRKYVVYANGSPAAMANVVVTDLQTREPVASITTDRNGMFQIPPFVRKIALTVTTPHEVAFISNIDIEHSDPSVRLTSNCSRFSGRIELLDYVPKNVLLRFSRISKEIGDSFDATVRPDGQFRICIPSGRYTVYLSDELAARLSMIFVPSNEPLSFRTMPKKLVGRTPASLRGIAPDSIQSFIGDLPSTIRLLGIGESNHGTRQFSEERTRLAIELADKRDFLLIMIEAGYGETLALDAYIGGANVDIAKAVERLGYWPWDTKTFLDSIEQLKTYNMTHATTHRIHLVGFDIQKTTGAVDYLTRNPGSSFSTNETELLKQLAEVDGRLWKDLGESSRSTLRATLERIAADRDESTDAFSAKNQGALSARSLLLRIEHLEAADTWSKNIVRDAGMSRMVIETLALEPHERATLWAHVGHLSRDYIVGSATAGHHLAAKFGKNYQVYALLAYAGSARAWDPQSKIGVIPHQLPMAPPDSVEANLFRYRGSLNISYWIFAHATGEAAQWLNELHRVGEFGSIYPGDQNVHFLWDLHSIDGVVLFDNVTPTIPTATGVRVAKPASP